MQKEQKNTPKQIPFTSHTDAQCIAGIAQDVVEPIILSTCAGSQVEKCQEIMAEKRTDQFMIYARMLRKQVSAKDCDIVRTKIFNFHRVRSVLISKAKKQSKSTNV